jgi:small conductance mechanosensitive channel
MEMENFEMNTETITALGITYGLQVVLSVLALVVGLWIVKLIVGFMKSMLVRSQVDPSLQGFLTSLVSILLKVMVYITALGVLGIEMTSFVAILGAAGLAVGLALSGTLQNFAGGVMILFFKTFKVGDFIDAQGYMGTVKEIQIFVTILTTPDNKTVIVPNGPLATGTLVNFSTQPTRRVDWTFGIAYGDSVDTAYEVLKELIAKDDRIKTDPAPFMAVSALADSSVNIVVRVWADSGNYWPVHFQMNESVYKRFPEAGLSIPFPQRDVHIHQEK